MSECEVSSIEDQQEGVFPIMGMFAGDRVSIPFLGWLLFPLRVSAQRHQAWLSLYGFAWGAWHVFCATISNTLSQMAGNVFFFGLMDRRLSSNVWGLAEDVTMLVMAKSDRF